MGIRGNSIPISTMYALRAGVNTRSRYFAGKRSIKLDDFRVGAARPMMHIQYPRSVSRPFCGLRAGHADVGPAF